MHIACSIQQSQTDVGAPTFFRPLCLLRSERSDRTGSTGMCGPTICAKVSGVRTLHDVIVFGVFLSNVENTYQLTSSIQFGFLFFPFNDAVLRAFCSLIQARPNPAFWCAELGSIFQSPMCGLFGERCMRIWKSSGPDPVFRALLPSTFH